MLNNNSSEATKDIPEISTTEIQVEIDKFVKSQPVNKQTRQEILGKILENLEPIDFRGEAGNGANEKVPAKTQVVLTIREVLRVAKSLDFGLCKYGDFIYLYNGAFWQLLDEDELKTFLGKAAEKCGVDAIAAEYYQYRDNLIKQFRAIAHLPKPAFDTTICLINLQNGTFEVLKDCRQLREFRRKDFLIYQLPFAFDSNAICPKFQKFLDEILPDKSSQSVLAEFVAYIFTSLKLEKVLILYGSGANGKSVFFDVINALMGRENVSNYSLESLSHEYYRAMIANKLLNYSSEISNRLQTEKFKLLASGEPVEARLPYGQPMTLTKYARLAFNCNELPHEVEHTEAFFQRFLIVPFDVTVPEEQRNPNLAKDIIETELSGVFNWVLDGLQRLLDQNKFSECEAASKALKTYREESDSVKIFLDEYNFVRHAAKTHLLKNVYSNYIYFCQSDGYRPLNKKNFSKRLQRTHDYRIERRKDGMNVFCDYTSSS